jgi:hypothetical protein
LREPVNFVLSTPRRRPKRTARATPASSGSGSSITPRPLAYHLHDLVLAQQQIKQGMQAMSFVKKKQLSFAV